MKKTSIKKLRLLISTVIGVAVISSALFLSGCTVSASVYSNSDKYTAGNATINDKVEELDINWSSGKLEIETHKENTIEIIETITGNSSEDKKVHWWLDGTTLRIEYQKSGISVNTAKKELKLIVPEDLMFDSMSIDGASANIAAICNAKKLEVDTASGQVKITADTKELSIDSASGDVDVTANASIIEVHSASGKISAVLSADVENSKFDSASGSINLSFDGAVKSIKANTASGSVSGAFAKAPEKLDIDTASGSVELAFPSDAGFTLKYDTASGGFNCELPMQMADKKYVSGDGSGEFTVNTASGSLKINEK